MRHLKLGVDIDGTIKDTHEAAVRVFNREYKKTFRPEEVTDYYLDRPYGLTAEEGALAWEKLEPEIYESGIPFANASKVLNDLAEQGHEIYYITARPDREDLRKITINWLKKHGFPFQEDRLLMGSYEKEKIAKQLGIDLFFEDAPNHLEGLVKEEIDVIVSDCVYNRDYNPDLPRMADWEEVYEIVEKKIKQLEEEQK